MADFDLSGFGDLSQFSLGGSEIAGPAFAGGYDLGPAVSSGFDFQAPMLAEPSAFANLASAAGALGQGIKSVTKPVAEIAGAVTPLAQLGTAGMGIASQIQGARQLAEQTAIAKRSQRMQEDTTRAAQAAAAPLTQFGSKQLELALAGQLPPAIESQIDNWKRGAMQQAADYAARSGQGDSQMLTQWQSWIEQQAAGMRANYIGELQRSGVTSLTAGAGAFGQAGSQAGQMGQTAAQAGGGLETLISSANAALSRLSAGAS